ncbi:hypothetical protein Psch_02417 [Pelotomaculum schinkii]|uniref:Transposase IS110-like N-terminal domain-containing protein n=2 Tax=Pelotomaculum schinkii TaxID=78350 RepID=A0A4Y7R9B5_9FIRM|nr:hypothetical protein Psch_02417 [Pelotomaculum schinkii]
MGASHPCFQWPKKQHSNQISTPGPMDAGHLQAARKAEVIAGFEHIEHYWFALGDHLVCQGHKLAIVNSFHVKRTKELDDNSPTKNDRKDPKTILDRHDEGI